MLGVAHAALVEDPPETTWCGYPGTGSGDACEVMMSADQEREGDARDRGPSPEQFWRAPLSLEACRAMLAKYEALAELEAQDPGPLQDRLLRAASRRWPGCLRESQLVGPERCAARREGVRLALASGETSARASWRARGLAAVPLWAELHALLDDQLRWRAQLGLGPAARPREDDAPRAFLDFARSTGASARWPTRAATLRAVAGPKVRSRQAYLWLAARAGLALPALNQILFARSGHWDQREGDPAP